ncbi:MAG: leucine-rich repeat domain-containing protein, partial [Muribaculaceae bacterium]
MAKKFTSPRCLTMIVALMFLSMWLPASAEPFNSSFLSFELNGEGTGYIVRGVYEGSQKPSGDVIIPAEHNGLPVVKIADLGFANWNKFSTLTLPNTIKEIGYKAFEYCSAMETLTIAEGSGLTTIGENAFYSCKKLGEVSLPGTVTTMGQLAFGNTGLVTVTLGEGITEIPAHSFYASSNLKNINFPESCTKIGNYAFLGCAFEELVFPTTIAEIGDGAFASCTQLTALDINVPTIGSEAFSYCSAIQTLKIGKDVASIGDLAFAHCGALNSIEVAAENAAYDSRESCNALVNTATNTILTGSKATTIPASVTAIGDFAFSTCQITTFTIPDNVATIGASAFYNCGSLESVVLPAGLTRIEDSTFYGCSSLANITIPDGVTYIGKEAFSYCSAITAIILPEGIGEYGDNAFYGTGLTSVTSLRATAVEANDELFGYTGCSVYTDATLTVPFGSRFSYYITTPWSKFSNLKEGIGNIVLTAPTFSVDGGTYDDDVTLEITNPNDRGKIYYYTSNDRTVREYTTSIKLTSPFNGDVIAIVIDGDDISECTVQYYDVNIPSLGITVGGVQVNEKNKGNVLGDYSVRYDDKSRILYLSSANIECKGTPYGIEIDDSSITIMLSGNNYISGVDFGIMTGYYGSGTLTIAGTDSETDALFIEPSVDWGEGIYVYLSNLKVENCKLVTNGGQHGITMKAGEGVIDGGLEISNASVDLTAGNSAISGVFRFTLGEGLTILEPEGAEFVACDGNFDNIQVDGVVQNHVLIGKTGTGVEGINAAQPATDGAIYDINGRRLERITQPGFYIV